MKQGAHNCIKLIICGDGSYGYKDITEQNMKENTFKPDKISIKKIINLGNKPFNDLMIQIFSIFSHLTIGNG